MKNNGFISFAKSFLYLFLIAGFINLIVNPDGLFDVEYLLLIIGKYKVIQLGLRIWALYFILLLFNKILHIIKDFLKREK